MLKIQRDRQTFQEIGVRMTETKGGSAMSGEGDKEAVVNYLYVSNVIQNSDIDIPMAQKVLRRFPDLETEVERLQKELREKNGFLETDGR